MMGLFDPLHLIEKLADAIIRVSRCDTVYEYEALAISYPLISQCRIFFLAGRIKYFQHACLCIYHDLLSVGVFDCRVVRFYKVVQTELGSISMYAPGGFVSCLTWMVRAVFPTPPSPRTTNLYRVILPAILQSVPCRLARL